MEPLDPSTTYLHLGVGPELAVIPVTDDFWPTIDSKTELHVGRLVTGLAVDDAWDTWEMHPAADEVIAVTSGTVRFHVDDGSEVTAVTVTAPELIVVPAGTWHTADAALDGPARLLVITWGEGTRHRPR